jgi:hypothetical protein
MTSQIRVGRGSKIAPKKGRYRVGQGRYIGRSKMAKKWGTSLMNVPFAISMYYLNLEFQKFPAMAFWVIAILGFSPYPLRVDFKGLIINKGLEIGFWAQNT